MKRAPQQPPKPTHHVKLLPGHPHEHRIGVLGDPVRIITGDIMFHVQFKDGSGCYARREEFQHLQPTSAPPPRKRS